MLRDGEQCNDFLNVPYMVRESRFHRGRDAQALMDATKIVIHEVQRNGVLMIFNFLGKGVRQTRKASHLHSHCQILSFNKTSGDVTFVWPADYRSAHGSDALCGAVAGLALCAVMAVELDEHGIINVRAEGPFDCIQIYAMAICSQLYAMRKTRCQVGNKVIGIAGSPTAYQPTRNKFRIGAKSRPRPNVSVSELPALVGGHILVFGVAEAPNFVALNSLAGQIPKNSVLVLFANRPDLCEKFDDCILRRACHTHRSADGVAFYQASDYLASLFQAQEFHTDYYA